MVGAFHFLKDVFLSAGAFNFNKVQFIHFVFLLLVSVHISKHSCLHQGQENIFSGGVGTFELGVRLLLRSQRGGSAGERCRRLFKRWVRNQSPRVTVVEGKCLLQSGEGRAGSRRAARTDRTLIGRGRDTELWEQPAPGTSRTSRTRRSSGTH